MYRCSAEHKRGAGDRKVSTAAEGLAREVRLLLADFTFTLLSLYFHFTFTLLQTYVALLGYFALLSLLY